MLGSDGIAHGRRDRHGGRGSQNAIPRSWVLFSALRRRADFWRLKGAQQLEKLIRAG
jgi:hypothetical protein